MTFLPSDDRTMSSPFDPLQTFCDHLDQQSMEELTTWAFQEWFTKIIFTSALVSWDVCSWNLVAILWGRPSHMGRPHVGVPADKASCAPGQQPASTAKHMPQETLQWLQLPPHSHSNPMKHPDSEPGERIRKDAYGCFQTLMVGSLITQQQMNY